MLITVIGRKTCRSITTPVNYYADGDTMWILSTRRRTWWRNVVAGAPVLLHLHGRDIQGLVDVVLNESDVARRIGEYVQHMRFSAKALDVRVQSGVANSEDTIRLAQGRLFTSVCISRASG